ncbi:hypothetical protein [Mucilaginibacter myungsuensis]|uniref:PliI/PliC-like inhibitor of I-type lysozyme n=1 Tax=Mucilaginibacter myungsuensis TaxID=649104 RepID=A0A929KSY2_9SPHI|nr:hypothetical protein [Mucilaginibacter myungsuensis]MBE9660954.1 hypothetical protein [Mucilaginibacter myungsuensis]MDN3601000.1 hypothetical protein [Mucilaginibacter myungsuensis]
MKKNLRGYAVIIAGTALTLAACSDDKPITNDTYPKPPAETALMQPFRFHKNIEVSPGHNFDIVSWGRGSKTVGSLLILRSDSADQRYTTTTGDIDGEITDVFNSDMDTDGNPELLVQAKSKDTIEYTSIFAYEFTEKANKLDFPKLTSKQKKGYRGNDNFYMKDGKLIREYPIFDGSSSTAKPTGAKRVLQYNLRSNSLTVKDLSADTLKIAEPKEEANAVKVAEKKEEPKKETVSKKKSTSSKKKTSSSKKKRRRR